MQNKFFSFAITIYLFLSLALPAQAAKPALLFILDGQSNAAPHANGKSPAVNPWIQIVPDTLIDPQKNQEPNKTIRYPTLSWHLGFPQTPTI